MDWNDEWIETWQQKHLQQIEIYNQQHKSELLSNDKHWLQKLLESTDSYTVLQSPFFFPCDSTYHPSLLLFLFVLDTLLRVQSLRNMFLTPPKLTGSSE